MTEGVICRIILACYSLNQEQIMRRLLFVLSIVFVMCGFCIAAEQLSYVDIIERLTDLERLAEMPVDRIAPIGILSGGVK